MFYRIAFLLYLSAKGITTNWPKPTNFEQKNLTRQGKTCLTFKFTTFTSMCVLFYLTILSELVDEPALQKWDTLWVIILA